METAADLASAVILLCGLFFFLSSILALWRFPDTLCRLHAITKADNLGLGCIIIAVALQVGLNLILLKLALIYFLVLYAAALNGYLIARHAHRHGRQGGKP